jgi:protein-S-isoprenylcysteine O-methyltransferase Ste14
MGNHHFEKWLYKTTVGFLLVVGGILFMYYSLSHFMRKDWIVYGLICSVGIGIGVYLLSSAAVNKVKSDIIKKQKAKQQSG